MEKKSPQEKLKAYSIEIAIDLKITEMTLSDKSFEIPQRKHYWAAKLIYESQELLKLEREKRNLEKDVLKSKDLIPTAMSQASVKNIINNTVIMQDIIQLIEDQKLLVEYLQKTEKIFAYITNDIKNIIDIIQMQLN